MLRPTRTVNNGDGSFTVEWINDQVGHQTLRYWHKHSAEGNWEGVTIEVGEKSNVARAWARANWKTGILNPEVLEGGDLGRAIRREQMEGFDEAGKLLSDWIPLGFNR